MAISIRVLPVAALACKLALCADPFYVGSWKIASAVVAPWWNEARKPDPAETKTLVGQMVAIKSREITGPRQVACGNPKYETKEYPADMLFQGGFGEMHMKDKSVDPGKTAAALGFKGTKWKTLETGCGNEVDFHFLDERTAAFGLNNYIYILKKQ
jgi:hypothetical protein